MCEIKRGSIISCLALAVLCGTFAGCTGKRERTNLIGAVLIGAESLLEDNPRSHFSRRINNAPLSGETVSLNPPRFRWSYTPNYRYTYPSTEPRESLFMFVFQIADEPSFKSPLVSAVTHVNFYNTLAPLAGAGPFYWRVGYIVGASAEGKEPSHWSPAREFKIAPDALVWDRSSLAKPDFSNKPHPRILISKDNRRRILKLIETDAHHKYMFEQMRQAADTTIAAPWYVDFMKSDTEEGGGKFYAMAKKLCNVAFIYKLTGDEKYAGVIDRAVTIASWPSGGRSSPEPIGDAGADASQTTEYLGLMYDWLYQDLTADQRKIFVKSLDWRLDHFMNHFGWKQTNFDKWKKANSYTGVAMIPRSGSVANRCESHSFESLMDNFSAALAAYEDLPIARECFELVVNWMVGVSSSHGQDEGWNEGPKYSGSKLIWEVHSLAYLDSVFPEFQAGRNPWIRRIGEWFSRVSPVGIRFGPWGHGSNRAHASERYRAIAFRTLAYLSGDGHMMKNWRESDNPGEGAQTDLTPAQAKFNHSRRPWMDLAVAAMHPMPADKLESDPVGLFPLAGWVMVGTKPPSSADCYKTSVGMIFQCRPMGAYSHSLGGDNSFHIYGYGEDLSFAAGTSSFEAHAFHSMSHNTILIDGLGQGNRPREGFPRQAFIRSFKRGDGYVYWSGDATHAYQKSPRSVGGFWGRLDRKVYGRRDAKHLKRFIRHVLFLRGKYFVIFDDLAATRPSTFSWLYHVRRDPMEFDDETMTIDYKVGEVPVRVVHITSPDELEVINMKGADGFKNPFTGEDYTTAVRFQRREKFIAAHNFYVSNKTKAQEFHFLSVIAPARPGEALPLIKRLDDWTVQVGEDIITFDPYSPHKANFVIDVEALRAKPPLPKWYKSPK